MSTFIKKHIGVNSANINDMLCELGFDNLDDFIKKTIPATIFYGNELDLKEGIEESEVINIAKKLADKNKVFTNFLGQGYYGTYTPSIIKRNILENPGWYTAYTPYQAEISQGRLEMLINFQQMIVDLTGLDIANSSLLDEATAAAEAVSMAYSATKNTKNTFVADINLHPQILTVLNTRSQAMGINMILLNVNKQKIDYLNIFAVVTQPFNTNGEFIDYTQINQSAKAKNVITIGCFDVLALTLFMNAKEMDYDIAVGSTQRFGVPLGFGGPHAAFLATVDQYKRLIPGRVIGVSKDKHGNIAYRMAMQTREQHIRKDKATSNICTSQVLLAIMAVSYVIYHGKDGIENIAQTVHNKAMTLANILKKNGYAVVADNFFDTISIKVGNAQKIWSKALANSINLRLLNDNTITIAIDETTSVQDITNLLNVFDIREKFTIKKHNVAQKLSRKSAIFQHPVFNLYNTETEMMRYLKRLENKDIALNHSMISLGSCTMKLNSATQMSTIAHIGFSDIHPYAPTEQVKGYQELTNQLVEYLKTITGYDEISLQPNAGSQGEFAGLLAIKRYHLARGDNNRNICLIPSSAHGTNPASAVMVSMKIQVIDCDDNGNIDINDLRQKINISGDNLAAIMLTYPSTHGVFEEEIKQICTIVHDAGGQVYIDGANLNAMVGISKLGKFGADVSHLNLHKTFAIPHGGGGPGVGAIGVKSHLSNFIPRNPLIFDSYAVSAAYYGNASILPISWSYIKLLGKTGLEIASKIAILNANYIAKKLNPYYKVLYTNKNYFVAHECIIDLRTLKKSSGVTEEDVAKRLIDYGFHAPTMSFPVAGTLMIEPTESESKQEIDRFIDAMICIYDEIKEIIDNKVSKDDNVLKNAPHTANEIINWQYSYSFEKALYPTKKLKNNKYFPPIKRVDNVYGDRNLFCVCPDLKTFTQ